MIVDSHHHFWDPARRDYPWMGNELKAIRQRFGPEELRPLLADNAVDQTILVQTVSSVEETREFLDTASRTDFIGGVVGWVDLTAPDVGDTIASLVSDLLVGIRHQVQDEADPAWLLRDDVQRGLVEVGEGGLVYDLLVKTPQLPAALETARRHRDITFVIDHAGKPRIAGPISGQSWDREWEKALAPFSDMPNVSCKLSGLVTEADWKSWTPEQLEPYVKRVVGWFGKERCMFGSDWPVCLLAASYDQVLDALQQIVGLDDDIFGGTATRVYGIAAPEARQSGK